MGRGMAREILQFLSQFQRHGKARIVDVKAFILRQFNKAHLPPRSPAGLGQTRGDVFSKAHRLADFANGAAWAIANQRRANCRAVAAIAFVKMLDHFFPTFMLEINVYIGRFAAAGGDKTFKQQIMLFGINGGNAKHVANRRIRRRTAPLAQNAARAGEANNLMHCQEIRRIAKITDQAHFMGDARSNGIRHLHRPARRDSFGHARFQALLCGEARVQHFIRVFVTQMIQRKAARCRQHVKACLQSIRIAREKPRHFGGGFQMAFRIGFRRLAQGIDAAAQANGAQHIRKAPSRWCVITNVVGGEQPCPGRFRQRRMAREFRRVITQQRARSSNQRRQSKAQPSQASQGCRCHRRYRRHHLPFRRVT